MEKKIITINLDSDVQTRKGVHANMVQAVDLGHSTRLDFILSDIEDENGPRGVLSARVYMDNANIKALRDLLIDHTATWEDGEDA